MGVRTAFSLIKSGIHNVVAVIGIQKMSERSSAEIQELMGRSGDVMWESPFGTTMPAYFAMYANAHMHEFGTTEEQLALVKVKSGKYGVLNPKAAFQKELSAEEVLKSRVVSSPLKLYDCCSNVDGASCIILACEKEAKRLNEIPVWISGLGLASAPLSLGNRENFTTFTSSVEASREAYEMAKAKPKDIDVAEIHDCFTITELISYEDLGFCERGKSGEFIEEGQSYIGGNIPVNVDGGLLSKGHPIGATGGSQIRTLTLQLRNQAGKIQVNGATTALSHNLGGIGTYCCVTILKV